MKKKLLLLKIHIRSLSVDYLQLRILYRVSSYTRPCFSGKSDLSSVHVYSSLHWKFHFMQGTRKTRSCLTGQWSLCSWIDSLRNVIYWLIDSFIIKNLFKMYLKVLLNLPSFLQLFVLIAYVTFNSLYVYFLLIKICMFCYSPE